MPEITSVETIRKKLREFDERMDGAISAAETISRIKIDAEKYLGNIQNSKQLFQQAEKKSETIRSELEDIKSHWLALTQEVDTVIQSLQRQLLESQNRLMETNRNSLIEQANLLKKLDTNTRESAEEVKNEKVIVLEESKTLNQKIDTKLLKAEEKIDLLTRENAKEVKNAKAIVLEESKTLNQKIDTKLLKAEEKIDLLFNEIEQKIEMQVNSIKEEIKFNILEHQQAIDRKLTEFLNRQNTLIQNLTQQIDSYNRVSQAQATEFSVIQANLKELYERLSRVESSLEEILEKLKKSFWVGGKFK